MIHLHFLLAEKRVKKKKGRKERKKKKRRRERNPIIVRQWKAEERSNFRNEKFQS